MSYAELWFNFSIPGRRERSPDYQKLRARDTHVWGIREGQLNRSAMEEPHPGGTALLITVTPTPGKYACRHPVCRGHGFLKVIWSRDMGN